MKARNLPKLSVSEYITLEKESDSRYEYHDGSIFALAGGTMNHGLLCGNIYSEIRNGLKANGSNCKPLSSEVKLYIKSHNSYVYPDTMVVCGEVEKAEEDKNAATNPELVVEILSKSTAEYDRGEKFHMYRQIQSLKEYVLIEQDKAVVEVFYKKPKTDLWKITRYEGLNSVINLRSLSLEIRMSELYFDIEDLLQ